MNKPFNLNLQLFAEDESNENADIKVNIGEILRNHTSAEGVIDLEKAESAIKSAVGRAYVPRARYNAKLNELDTLTTEKATLEDKLTTAEKWKGKYEDEHKAFEKFKGETDAQTQLNNVKAAYRAMLKDVGIADKYIDIVIKATTFDDKKLDADGKLEKLDELKAAAEKDWADFKVTQKTKGANVETPPTGGNPPKRTKEEIIAIKDSGERQKAIAENHELFGF